MAVALPPSVLPDISPSRGEIDKQMAPRSLSTGGVASCERRLMPQVISPLEGEMSGRTEGGNHHAPRGQTHAR
ncbi:precorrin-3B synthase/fused signal recognition particle receptor/diaminohydroxyphosphoribosylaminopyrimidine deaminase/5-amino-6-(5-phosphoribosylamino)uracil reductase [Rhizobium sp. UGM030330-04]|nr:precorrin-3B synthase/fused signal recognition particle receptor/diaminohydroxyphosphoribosylaminopyrimidine deaminase/5-amino-6-(5-phosphoribosylamino)uracil reductase [Rhizobium sp. UGM030330-04]